MAAVTLLATGAALWLGCTFAGPELAHRRRVKRLHAAVEAERAMIVHRRLDTPPVYRPRGA
jgi:hypothetical protein